MWKDIRLGIQHCSAEPELLEKIEHIPEARALRAVASDPLNRCTFRDGKISNNLVAFSHFR